MNATDAPCRQAMVTVDAHNCFADAQQKADVGLNAIYKRVQTVLQGGELEKLRQAQRLWIRFRDANCQAEEVLYDSGTGGPKKKLLPA
jgi:uncharacterized protein YecT (DUF1311 family)